MFQDNFFRELVVDNFAGIAWFSPDCKHFSRAKGGKPVEKKDKRVVVGCAEVGFI